ncbi:hypothetical protein Goarm_014272, partial [Gossypium armourianum]|nr:hypothetical protein [Gossypium armourianum]
LAKSHLKKTVSNDCFYSQRKRVIISSHNLYSLEYESIGRNGSFDENLVALELDYPMKDKPNGLAELLDSARDGFLYCERSEEGNDEFPVMMKIPFFCLILPLENPRESQTHLRVSFRTVGVFMVSVMILLMMIIR